MRTTLEIDDDLLIAAKELAHQKGMTLGAIISVFTREGLATRIQSKVRNGALLLEPWPGASVIDLSFVNSLRDEE